MGKRSAKQEFLPGTLDMLILKSLTRGVMQSLQAKEWPRITRFDDRWRWIVTSIVPRFRRFDADTRLAEMSLRRIFTEAADYASNPCVLPARSAAAVPARRTARR